MLKYKRGGGGVKLFYNPIKPHTLSYLEHTKNSATNINTPQFQST